MIRTISGARLSFQDKSLILVVVTMVGVTFLTTWAMSREFTRQVETDSTHRLLSASTVIEKSERLRARNLLWRYHNVPNEPRFKAVSKLGEPNTLRFCLNELLGELGGEIVVFTGTGRQRSVSSSKDPLLTQAQFEAAAGQCIRQALDGQEFADVVRVGHKLFDAVSVPVNINGATVGVLTFGVELGPEEAREFSQLTHSEVVLLANGRVAASTLAQPELFGEFSRLYNESAANTYHPEPTRNVVLNGEHYLCLASAFPSTPGDARPGYLLLSSYEQPLRALEDTQRLLLWTGLVAVTLATLVVWLLLRRLTRPLRQLRESAEAVGRGDFSRRVPVITRDEFGELAGAFNRMTENLKTSRAELEQTVETLKTTQHQLVQSEKLSGLGEFVAGVAHELNNPLTSVMGFAELLQRSDVAPTQKRHLELIFKSAQRCQKIVQNLLSFARRHKPERKLVAVNELIGKALEIVDYQMRTSNISVTTQLAARLPKVMADPNQLQQVFLNIINNARQAMEEHQPKGSLHISTAEQDGLVQLIFKDDGPGISEGNMAKIFDPFFTTKQVGKGTGLGLSLCYGIIKEHGGTILVRSEPGQGASFIVQLPVAEQGAGADKADTAFLPAPTSREGAGKRVLVVDDEEPILEMIRETLSGSGYRVETVATGEAALNRLGGTQFDLTICDLKMPGLNGQQVYERLRAASPAQAERIIFMTGDVVNEKVEQFLQQHGKLCLSKPFSLAEFRSAVGRTLAAA